MSDDRAEPLPIILLSLLCDLIVVTYYLSRCNKECSYNYLFVVTQLFSNRSHILGACPGSIE